MKILEVPIYRLEDSNLNVLKDGICQKMAEVLFVFLLIFKNTPGQNRDF